MAAKLLSLAQRWGLVKVAVQEFQSIESKYFLYLFNPFDSIFLALPPVCCYRAQR